MSLAQELYLKNVEEKRGEIKRGREAYCEINKISD